MTLKRLSRGLLLAPLAALLLSAAPHAAMADPPQVPPGQAKKFGGHGCPPGLAKKNPLCMPPGQYKKYQAGDKIPAWRSFERLDYRDYGLRYPGDGRQYIRIGNDAYLVAEATQRVIEVINLLGR